MRIQVLEILISYESGSCMVPQRFLLLQFQVCQPNVFSLLIAILALYPRKQFQLKFWMLQAKDLSNIRDGLCGHHELIQKWFERIITHHTKRSFQQQPTFHIEFGIAISGPSAGHISTLSWTHSIGCTDLSTPVILSWRLSISSNLNCDVPVIR